MMKSLVGSQRTLFNCQYSDTEEGSSFSEDRLTAVQFTHLCLASHKRSIENSVNPDQALFCGVKSGSRLFAVRTGNFIKKYVVLLNKPL